MKNKNKKGFTLIELLVVVAIIGILASVGVVAYNGYTSSAQRSASSSNHNSVAKWVANEFQKCAIGDDFAMNGLLDCVDDTGTPAFMTALEGAAHQIDVAHTLKAVVNAAICHLNQMINDVVHFAGVHEIGHAELGSEWHFARVQVYPNDATCSHQLGTLNHIESDSSEAEYGNGGAGFHFHGESDGANPCGDTTADVANFFERRIASDFCQSYFR